MQWLDIFGPPGVGKSTIVDPLWPPKVIEGDGLPYPESWDEFTACVGELLVKVKGHPSFNACESMIARSFRKMASVSRIDSEQIYIQTGLAQRGLGLGWRLKDPNDVRPYFELMPVSLGVVMLSADSDVIRERNFERGQIEPKKDRGHMIKPMEATLKIARTALQARGVPFLELDTEDQVHVNQQRILAFVGCSLKGAKSAARYCHQSSVFPASLQRPGPRKRRALSVAH